MIILLWMILDVRFSLPIAEIIIIPTASTGAKIAQMEKSCTMGLHLME